MTHRIAIIGTGFRPQGNNLPPAEIDRIVDHGFSAELVEIPDGIFPSDPAARSLVDEQYRAIGQLAEKQGFDALYINTFGDYGLRQLREALSIPVVGSGETACRTAAMFGPFSIVTIWPPSLAFLYDRVLAHSGVGQACLGITHLSADEAMGTLADDNNFVTDMRACALTSMQSIAAARDSAVEDAGAAAVLLGCTCMAPAAAMLPPHANALTLDPLTLGYHFTQYCLGQGLSPQDVDYDPWAKGVRSGMSAGQ